MPFYAVANGNSIGIFTNWNECKESINGFKNAKYKKFDNKEDANNFINEYNNQPIVNTQQSISSFFESNHTIDTIPKNTIEIIPDYYVYTDGACIHNGKQNALGGIGIYFGENDARNVSKRFYGKQSNNIAELLAIIETHKIITSDLKNGSKIGIVSDSEYAINAVSSYGEKCCNKKWDVTIPNKELVKIGYELYKNESNVVFIHIKAHTNKDDIHSIGNDHADKLANQAIGLTHCPYNKIHLNVPFAKKDSIKELGGKWNSVIKKWYIYENNPNKEDILKHYSVI